MGNAGQVQVQGVIIIIISIIIISIILIIILLLYSGFPYLGCIHHQHRVRDKTEGLPDDLQLVLKSIKLVWPLSIRLILILFM